MASVNDLQLNTTITLQDNFSSRMGGFASSIGRVHGMLENLNKTMNNITRTISAPMGNVFSNSLTRIGRSTHRANIELNMLNNTLRRTVGLTSRLPTGGLLNRVGTVGSTGGGDTPSLNPSSVFSGFGDLLKNNIVTALVGAFGSVAVLKQTQKLFEDATKQMTVHQRLSHLDFVAKGETNINDLKDSIFGASMRSKTNYLDFANMVQKIGARSGGAFGSSGELIQFTEQLQKLFTTDSDMDASSRISTTIQLSRALVKGKMEGRELNQVLYNTPSLINLIAKTLKKPETEIYKLASEGQITANVVKKAIFDNADEINKKFLDMPDGWGEVMIRINNYAQHAFQGVYQKITDIFTAERIQKIGEKIAPIFYNLASIIEKVIDGLTVAIDWLLNNWDSIMKNFVELTTVFGTLIAGATAFNFIMATGPIGWIMITIGALEALVIQLNSIYGTSHTLFGYIAYGLGFIVGHIMNAFKFTIFSITWVIGLLGKIINRIINFFGKVYNALVWTFQNAWIFIKTLFYNGINNLFQGINNLAKGIVNILLDVVNSFLEPLEKRLSAIIGLSNKINGTKLKNVAIQLGVNADFWKNQNTKVNQSLIKEAQKSDKEWIKSNFNSKNNLQISDQFTDSISDSILNGINTFDPQKQGENWQKATENFNLFSQLNQPKNSKMLKWDNVSTGFDKSKVLNDIKSNTDDIKNHTDFSKYLRELADRNTINHFTTPTYNIKLESQNTINSQSDVNGFVERVADEIKEALTNSIQGDYNSYGGAFA